MLNTENIRKDFLSIRHIYSFINTEKRHSLHHLNLLKTIGLLEKKSDIAYRRAVTYRDLRQAYVLGYRIFLEKRYIEPNFTGMRLREWELNPDTRTFIAECCGEVIGTGTLAPEIAGRGLPTEWLYPEEIAAIRRNGGKIAEVCNGAVARPYRNNPIPIEFFRCMLASAWTSDVKKMVTVINKSHKSFYEFIYTVQIGEEKSYSDAYYDPVILMYLDCELLFEYLSSPESDNGGADSYLRNFLLFKNPYLALAPEWEKKARAAFKRQRIRERFQDEIRNSLVASVWHEPSPPSAHIATARH
jgi:hypothetical protein